MDVWVAGVGEIPCRKEYVDADFREMLYRAAVEAYGDAEMDPSCVDGVVSSGIDFYEGMSITDSYTPDQVGGRLKFNSLVSNDSLNAFIHGCMLIKTGRFKTILVAAYSKPSNMLNYPEILLNSLDPHLLRPLLPPHYALAALDAQAFLHRTRGTGLDLTAVAAKNKNNAVVNPSAAYGERKTVDEFNESETVSTPLKRVHVAPLADYAAVVILTKDSRYGKVLVEGVGFSQGLQSTDLSSREWGRALWVRTALAAATKGNKAKSVDFVEVSEPFAHTELMILDELRLWDGPIIDSLRRGEFDADALHPVNPSGGCIGMGYALNASGLQRVVQSVKLMESRGWHRCLAASVDGEIADGGSVVVLRRME
ncbi:MAG: hypothetical protein QXS57_04395 [Candidatus Caldarchaeum sp.]